MMNADLNYPDFTNATYRKLIQKLSSRWRILRLCDAAGSPFEANTLILRHDIDVSPALALPISKIEHAAGIRSTYFVALHLYYNSHLPIHAEAIRDIAAMGHEIGFHYDGNLYPHEACAEQNLALLDRHVQILQEICCSPIVSIARHNPSLATRSDPLKTSAKYNNAYDDGLFQNTIYISDSCGAWRAAGLKPCWDEPRPDRIYLLLHAEQWAERTDIDRMSRFEIMRARALKEHEMFFDEVRSVWREHAGGKEHDERLRRSRQAR
ncbi:MAG: hypothetical protein ACREQ7_03900 [Candidatus Binatia bacterium]